MSYTPSPRRKNAYCLSLLFFACAFIALFTASLTPTRAVMQFIAVGCATGGIFILSRYALQTFVYLLDDAESETNDLIVNRVQGRRITTVCRLSFSQCIGFEKKTNAADTAKYGKIASRHNYIVNLSPESVYLLYFKEEGAIRLILLECDDAFAAAIRRRLLGV